MPGNNPLLNRNAECLRREIRAKTMAPGVAVTAVFTGKISRKIKPDPKSLRGQMGAAAKGIESLRIGNRWRSAGSIRMAESRARAQPVQTEGGQVRTASRSPVPPAKNRAWVGSSARKSLQEFRADLVGALADRRADHRGDVGTSGAQRFHRLQHRLEDPGQRAAPARMGGADHPPGGAVGQQDRLAIGGQHRQRQAGLGVGDRPSPRAPPYSGPSR